MKKTIFGLGLLVASVSAPAFAQDVATAEALFNKGVADLQAGKFDTACPAINESYRLDPRPGTLFTLAECYAKAGKSASAVARYDDYLSLYSRLSPADQAKQNGRDKKAMEEKAKLAPTIPQLTVTLPKDAPQGTTVRRDETTLTGPSIGLALPVDPGQHVIVTQAPGGAPVETRVTIAAGEKKTVEANVGAASSATPASSAAPPLAPTTTPSTLATATPNHEASARGDGQRTAGLVVGGVGAAGLVVGLVTGGIALGKKSTITANCDATTKVCSNSTGKSAVDSAQSLGTISTIGVIAGGVLLAGGAVLYVTAPKHAIAVGLLDAGPRGASLGAFGQF